MKMKGNIRSGLINSKSLGKLNSKGIYEIASSRFICYFCITLIVLLCSCSNSGTTSLKSQTQTSSNSTSKGADDPFLQLLIHEKLEWMSETWRSFIADGRYRLANQNDFTSPASS